MWLCASCREVRINYVRVISATETKSHFYVCSNHTALQFVRRGIGLNLKRSAVCRLASKACFLQVNPLFRICRYYRLDRPRVILSIHHMPCGSLPPKQNSTTSGSDPRHSQLTQPKFDASGIFRWLRCQSRGVRGTSLDVRDVQPEMVAICRFSERPVQAISQNISGRVSSPTYDLCGGRSSSRNVHDL